MLTVKLTTLLKSAYDVQPTNRPFPNRAIDAENEMKFKKENEWFGVMN